MKNLVMVFALVVSAAVAAPSPLAAYLGPGGVVSGLGAVVALAGAIVASLLGFLWFPIKRLVRRARGASDAAGTEMTASTE